MIAMILIVALIPMLAVMGMGFRYLEGIEEENRMLQNNVASSRMYAQALSLRMEEIRRFRHDAAGMIQAMELQIAGAADGGKPAGRSACTEAVPEGPGAEQEVFGQMPLLQAILQLKRQNCLSEEIPFAMRLTVTEPDHLPPEDALCPLLLNLLDNAIEENRRIQDPAKRMLHIVMEQACQEVSDSGSSDQPAADKDACIRIRVINRLASDRPVSFRSRKPRPEQHGIGLRIVDDIAASYGGRRRVMRDPAGQTLITEVSLRQAIPGSPPTGPGSGAGSL